MRIITGSMYAVAMTIAYEISFQCESYSSAYHQIAVQMPTLPQEAFARIAEHKSGLPEDDISSSERYISNTALHLRIRCKERGRFVINQLIEHVLSPKQEHCGVIVAPGTLVSYAQKDGFTPAGDTINSQLGSIDLVELTVQTKVEWDAKHSENSITSTLSNVVDMISPPSADLDQYSDLFIRGSKTDQLDRFEFASALLGATTTFSDNVAETTHAVGRLGVDMLRTFLSDRLGKVTFVMETLVVFGEWMKQFSAQPKIM